MKKLHELPKLALIFWRLFNVSLQPYVDNYLSELYEEVVFDILKFDEYLHTLDNYEKRGLSMKEFIQERFGKASANLIQELIHNHKMNEQEKLSPDDWQDLIKRVQKNSKDKGFHDVEISTEHK